MSKKNNKKGFWSRPEGVTGIIFMIVLLTGLGLVVGTYWTSIVAITQNIFVMTTLLVLLAVVIYIIADPSFRTLVSYFYKSVMRWITGFFVTIDPIKVLKNYVEELDENLNKMNQQINQLRQQIHLLREQIFNNKKNIEDNLKIAKEAKANNQRRTLILKSRKAGRLKESNLKLEDLLKKMEVLYKVIARMYDNSYILREDIADQVDIKEKERNAIRASHNAMASAMKIIKGEKDKLTKFDQALEAIADDVSQKVGEMEQFMEMSDNFMKSIDLRNGIFEEEGLEMLKKWEDQELSLLLGEDKDTLLLEAEKEAETLDLNQEHKSQAKLKQEHNQYDSFFDD